MSSALKLSELVSFLKQNQLVSTQQLLEFYRTFEPDIKATTLRWRIYHLKQANVIYTPKRGMYALQGKKAFQPEQTEKMQNLAQTIQAKYPYVNFSIYPTEWLADLTEHVYQSRNIILEVDADALNSVFHFVKEQYPNVYISPDKGIYDLYISPREENIIVNRLYVDAPLNRVEGNYHLPKLEKLLVDLIINDPLILPVSESDVKTVITNAREKYNVNHSTLLRYARKRRIEQKLIPFGLMEREI
ncbi:hypothetical protein C8U37_11099 [Trichococcus patagoniensis]|uniref:Uncharacterized protein n=1 Tax=Trichococcus patagoniensis TaxID=382641 RepID=A0A2T5IK46_9LACT|nr:DUF6577 family protein [Trichococcus patagoniensis]PTQ84181.1 hypothetical protein C8U37_11099 [Trichococcus patagoniensis]